MKKLIALALFWPMSLFAAEEQSDDATTLTSLSNQIETLQDDVDDLDGKLTSLTTKLDNADDKLDLLGQIAIIMVVPHDCENKETGIAPTGRVECRERFYLLGETIDDFPNASNALNTTTLEFTGVQRQNREHVALIMPQGKYLVELHQPYSDNPLCQSSVSSSYTISLGSSDRPNGVCPQLSINTGEDRLDHGSRIYEKSAAWDLKPRFRFPASWRDRVVNRRDLGKHHATARKVAAEVYPAMIKITKLRN